MTPASPRSFSAKIWRPRAEVTDHHRELTQNAGLDPIFAPILAHRGLEDGEAVERYLRPRLQQLADPAGIRDMAVAVKRLIQAIEQQESIAIFGDYDVDGATSSALLVRYFRALGIAVRVYIPNRLTEGYGPNSAAMQKLADEGVTLVITVDCGITAFEALQTAAESGLAVIVTDHHQGRESLPPAVAVLNPNRLDDPFPNKELAGVGVAFYLVMALNRALRERGHFSGPTTEPDLKPLLDLVAIGTIADVAQLTGANRPLVAAGLRQAATGSNLGLRQLMTSASIRSGPSAGQVGFQIGPRINAGGRLGKGELGPELLTTEDPERADAICQVLENSNKERQTLEQRILKEAMSRIENDGDMPSRLGVVAAATGWHPGVIGIVASRMCERLYRPVIVIALDDAGQGKGSGRSLPGINLLAAIEQAGTLLTTFGGHKAAAGLSLAAANLEPFARAFDQAIRAQNDLALFQPTLRVDGPLAINRITKELTGRLQRLQPFGRGNPEPVFVLENVRLAETRVLKGRHIKGFLVTTDNAALEAIAFRALPGPLGEGLMGNGKRLDVAGTLSINRFRDRETVQFTIQDARPAQH